MKKVLSVLFGLALMLSLPPASRSEDSSGKLLAQTPAPAKAPAPQINSFNPQEVKEGEKLTLTGTNFGTNPKDVTVTLGDKPAQVQNANATSITVVVPSNLKGTSAKVTVTCSGQRSNQKEIKLIGPPPELDSVSLSSASPGASLSISGKNFSTTASENIVTIGGAQAQVTSASANSLSVVIPHDIESPQEAQVTVTVGKQHAKNNLQIMIQSREY